MNLFGSLSPLWIALPIAKYYTVDIRYKYIDGRYNGSYSITISAEQLGLSKITEAYHVSGGCWGVGNNSATVINNGLYVKVCGKGTLRPELGEGDYSSTIRVIGYE